MDWNAYRMGYGMGYEMGYEAAIREYEERTFADWMDGRRDDSINDDTYDDWEEDTYDQ